MSDTLDDERLVYLADSMGSTAGQLVAFAEAVQKLRRAQANRLGVGLTLPEVEGLIFGLQMLKDGGSSSGQASV